MNLKPMFKPLAFSVLVLIACSASLLARTAESGWLIDNGLKLLEFAENS